MNVVLKKLVSAFVAVVLITTPGIALAQEFTDVGPSHPYYEAVENLAVNGMVNGYSDKSFRADRPINRAEVAKILISSTNAQSNINNALDVYRANNWRLVEFEDVLTQSWYAPYIALAKKDGVVQGYPDGYFRPSNSINFAEGLKMIVSAYGGDVRRMRAVETPYILMRETDWFARYFAFARSRNLINPSKFYHPAQLMTRGEFADVLYRMKFIMDRNLRKFPGDHAATNEYRVSIPKLGLVDMKVGFADPYDPKGALELLRRVPFGHYLAKPGTGNKFVLFGHSSGYAWDSSPFKVVLRQINKLVPGDRIYINYRGRGYVYEVSYSTIIPANKDYTILNNPNKNILAIYTCWPLDSIKERYVVYAQLLF